MGDPYLNSDESIILSTHDVVVDSLPSEAMLTSRRLILFDSSHDLFKPRDIPLAAIATVLSGEAGSGDPAVNLSITTRGGTILPMAIVFPPQARRQRVSERDEWIEKLKEQIALVPPGSIPAEADLPGDGRKGAGFADSADSVNDILPDGARKSPGSGRYAPLSARIRSPAPSKARQYVLIAAAAIVLLLIAGAGAAFIYPGFLQQKTPLPPVVPVTTTPVPEKTPVSVPTTPLPTAVPSPAPAITTVPASRPDIIVPASGVWVRIRYTGGYTGTIGTAGRMREISGSGDRFIQVPAGSTDIVDIYMRKEDYSGALFSVDLYNKGGMVKSITTSVPRGSIELHVNLNTAQPPAVTPAVLP